MTLLEAIEKRTSRRSYLNTPIEAGKLQKMKDAIHKYNMASGLSIQFVKNGKEAFQGLRKSYGMFHGVRSFIALVGKTSDPDLKEKAGYYGELLVLEATTLGLGTCFVGGTYDKKNCLCKIENHETLVCVITIGNVEDSPGWKEKMIYRMAHRGSIRLEKLYESDQGVPSWFLKGIKAVQAAPSSLNRHPAKFVYQSGMVSAYVENTNGFNLVDLGIAKANFEIASGVRLAWTSQGF
jgi:nitroreductase